MAPQVFTGQVAEYMIRIDHPHTIRSAEFTKAEDGTRLRITYRDKAVTGPGPSHHTTTVQVVLDGALVPLLRTVFDSPLTGRADQFNFFSVSSPFTTVGYVSDVPAGIHRLESRYLVAGENGPIVGFVSDSPYLIEIDEMA